MKNFIKFGVLSLSMVFTGCSQDVLEAECDPKISGAQVPAGGRYVYAVEFPDCWTDSLTHFVNHGASDVWLKDGELKKTWLFSDNEIKSMVYDGQTGRVDLNLE